MDRWLEQETLSRLLTQVQSWADPLGKGLYLGMDQALLTEESVGRDLLAYDALKNLTPGPHYSHMVAHLVPAYVLSSETFWPNLAFVSSDTAMLYFSCWGVDTLREFSEACQQLMLPTTQASVDMHDTGDQLTQAGWGDVVMSAQPFTVQYAHPEALLADVDTVGHFSHLTKRESQAACDPLFSADSPVTISYELILGHAVFSREGFMRSMGQFEVPVSSITS